MQLIYRKIKDGELSFADRIVYSIFCTAHHFRKEFPSISHFRKVTGFRADSILASLHNLRERGYIYHDAPVQSPELRYETITIVCGKDVKHQVFFHVVKAMAAATDRKLSSCYWEDVFGLTRQQCSKLINKMADGWTPDKMPKE